MFFLVLFRTHDKIYKNADSNSSLLGSFLLLTKSTNFFKSSFREMNKKQFVSVTIIEFIIDNLTNVIFYEVRVWRIVDPIKLLNTFQIYHKAVYSRIYLCVVGECDCSFYFHYVIVRNYFSYFLIKLTLNLPF